MSKHGYIEALQCKAPESIPHKLWLLHPEFVADCTGVDFYEKPMTASIRFHERFHVDSGGPTFVEETPLPRPRSGSTEDGGESRDEGFNTIWHNASPFAEPEDLWSFDPDPWGRDCEKALEPEYATKNFRWCFHPETWAARRAEEDAYWAKVESIWPSKFTDVRGFYCTSFMWGICIFGWDVFLTALALDPDKTGETIHRISDITAKMYEYFATCEGAAYAEAHDDLCISSGPVTSPEWYIKYIYPEYERIFAPIKAAGKSVLLLSDGDITKLAADVAPLVDGFIFESSTPPDYMFEQFGRTKSLTGGIDVRPITFGTPADVDAEVRRAIERAGNCPGWILACSNTIPGNVPIENVYAYFEAVEKYRRRSEY